MPAPDLYSALADALEASATSDWRTRARPAQLPPLEYAIWLVLSGRGWGKNFAAGNLTCELAGSGAVRRIALVGPTWDHVRQTMVEGNSGILTLAPTWCRPTFEASKSQLVWPSGAIATMYSADTPEALRGPEHDFAWCDELASWRRTDTWDNLGLTMRIGRPRVVVTTTPKPTRLIRDLVSREGKDGIVITRGSTFDNRANLAPTFFSQLVRRYEGTRLGRQELLGEVLDDVPGALWAREVLEETRVEQAPPLQRIVIGVDPAGSTAEGADLTGILACGIGHDGHLYVLSDLSCRGTPREWASKVVGAYHSLRADKVVVETNFGGQMAAATLASVDPAVPVKEISSSRGKVLRAEPIASLFEQKRAHIVGSLPELEDQMCSFTSDWDRARDGSPDRVDALVFSGTELMIGRPVGGYFSEQLLLVNGAPVPLPEYPQHVIAVAAASPAQDSIGVLYLADCRSVERPCQVVLLDYELESVSASLFEEWLPKVFERLRALARECKAVQHLDPFGEEPAVALFCEPDGVGAALLQAAQEQGLRAFNIAESLDLPRELSDRVSDVSSWLHAGKAKIGTTAHERVLAHQGVTRNHFLAQFSAYRIGGEGEESSELLSALCAGLVIVNPEDVRRKKRKRA